MEAHSLNHLFMQAPVAICIVSGANYKVELVNERMLQFLGRTDNIVGRPLEESLTEVKKQGLLAILDNVSQTGQPYYAANFLAVILIDGVRETRYFNLVFKPYFLTPADEQPTGVFCVAHNTTEQVLAAQKLQEEKSRTTLALETGGLGMITTQWKTNLVTADKRTGEIFGLQGSHTLEDYMNRIHPADRHIRQKAIEESDKDGRFDFEVRLLFKDGSMKWMQSRGLIQKDGEGNITGSFGVVQDVTGQKEFELALQKKVEERTAELKEANNTLRQLNEELARSNENLEEFARAASHDLKEPVRKMRVFASKLAAELNSRMTEGEKELFAKVENAAERMSLLVDDLLEYSYLDQLTQQPERIDLNEKISRILLDIELLVNEKRAVINIGKLPVVSGHRRQLQQLFQNLLTNALKYSRPDAGPHITITSKLLKGSEAAIELPQAVQDTMFYLIEVSDNGIGFHQSDADKIFHVFTRLHRKDEYSGTGIGLSIAKKVVENHQGFIYAKSQPGQGACFSVLLPAAL